VVILLLVLFQNTDCSWPFPCAFIRLLRDRHLPAENGTKKTAGLLVPAVFQT